MISLLRIFALASLSPVVFASPTAEDFRNCHRVAAAALEACLNENPGSQNTSICFNSSSGVLSKCVTELKSSHSSSVQRREAAKSQTGNHVNRVEGGSSKQVSH